MNEPKRNVRDSIFVNIFRDKRYLAELYRSLHPEDVICEDDLKLVTIENVLADDMYNDLGFVVGNRLIVLVEAQTTWSPNIIVRMFLYLARTYQDMIHGDKNLRVGLYGSRKLQLPKPELYVIYTGDKGDKKDILSLRDKAFPGSDVIDLRARVIYVDEARKDIIGQYIMFCVILKEQNRLHKGNMQKAIQETIRICIATNNLKEYLIQHKKEVEEYMFAELSQKEIFDDMVDIAREKGMAEGLSKGRAEGTLKTKTEAVRGLLSNKVPINVIAESLSLSIDQVNAIANQK